MENKANDVQVGGTHYGPGNQIQHWDLSVMFKWDPFQYQITKYVMRWKDKHATPEKRLEDLKKARHFLDKYIEVAANYDTPTPPAAAPAPTAPHPDWQWEGGYGDMSNAYKCRRCGTVVRAFTPQQADAEHGTCAPRVGYVQQG